jgi:hypothetical protein
VVQFYFIVGVLLKIFNNSALGTRFVILLLANCFEKDINKALELASVCEHPNAVWLTKLLGGRDISSREEARQVFLACENDPRALCYAGLLEGILDETRRAADVGDAFAQSQMPCYSDGEGRKNLLLKENAMVSTTWDIATKVEKDARKTRKKQKRTFWLPLGLDMCMGWCLWESYLTKTILNDLLGLEELLQIGTLFVLGRNERSDS